MTASEWEVFRDAMQDLPDAERSKVISRASALAGAPITCPLLDAARGQCLVYEARPIACRTYGFYRERNNGLYCSIIRGRVESGQLDHVVWGNQETIAAAQQELGTERDLLAWMQLENLK